MSRDPREVIRDEPLMRRPVLAALGADSRTVPELAAALGAPPEEVMAWVMGLRKYGYVAEEQADDGYYRYRAVRQP
jgi:DNA-binding IclR family transcriptional regulator